MDCFLLYIVFRIYIRASKKLTDNQSSLRSVLLFFVGFWCGLLLSFFRLWVTEMVTSEISIKNYRAFYQNPVSPVTLHVQYAYKCERAFGSFVAFGLRQNCFVRRPDFAWTNLPNPYLPFSFLNISVSPKSFPSFRFVFSSNVTQYTLL